MSQNERTEEIARVAKASNSREAELWRQILEENGIRCQVVGEYLEELFGALPPSYPEVWVNRSDLEQARAVLDARRLEVREEQQERGPETDTTE